MQAGWIERLGAVTVVLVVAGFAVTGLSRLVVSVETARLLSAPLLFGGFLAAVVTFLLAVLTWIGVLSTDG